MALSSCVCRHCTSKAAECATTYAHSHQGSSSGILIEPLRNPALYRPERVGYWDTVTRQPPPVLRAGFNGEERQEKEVGPCIHRPDTCSCWRQYRCLPCPPQRPW